MSHDQDIDLREQDQRQNDIYDAYFRGEVTLDEALDNLPVFFAIFIPLIEGRLPQLEQQMARNTDDSNLLWSTNGGGTYYERVERNIIEAYLSQNSGATRFFTDQLPPSFGPPLPPNMSPEYGSGLLRGFPFFGDYGSDSHYSYSLEADADDSDTDPICIQFEDDDADIDNIPEDEKCNLCDCKIAVHFGGCSHAVCNSCSVKLWLSRVKKDGRPLPTWFKCPWCRTEVTKLGTLLHEQQLQIWSEDKVKHGKTSFCIGTWYSLQEWMSLNGVCCSNDRGGSLSLF